MPPRLETQPFVEVSFTQGYVHESICDLDRRWAIVGHSTLKIDGSKETTLYMKSQNIG